MSEVCILHDTFIYKGGAERLVLMMAKALKSDIASGYFDHGSFDPEEEGFQGKIISLGKRGNNKYWRQIKLQLSILLKTRFLRDYKTVIFSGDCLLGLYNTKPSSRKIYYCHTPPRYLFDQSDLYEKKVSSVLKPFYAIFVYILRKQYLYLINRFDIIYTNSKNTQERLIRYTGKESTILYPPVDTSIFSPGKAEKKDYYFSYARLSDIKRVDTIVRVFRRLPHKKLVIHHGVNDPQIKKIQNLVLGYKNISLVHIVNQEELIQTIRDANAVIYIPKDEDFGLIPIEAMSCGIPVIGVNEGGLKETILDNKTGTLIDPFEIEEGLQKAVEKLSLENCAAMKDACIKHIRKFSLEIFESALIEEIHK